ncbi:hypothetical protein SNE40_020253 [Patella caerulea]|uniref:RING-type domain-containing protein n=1 Tax=Patella caerulea TaxID=87958 RepID=A0AAN8J071_PATCE
MSRYDVDKFVPPPDQELICCICTNVLDEPMECPCRHVFCKVCIETWLNNKHNCPTCRNRVEKNDLKTVLPLVRNMLNKLTLTCDFVINGCKDKITLEKYSVHIKVCGYEIVVCKYPKCSQTMLRKLIQVHEEQQCLYREIACKKQCGLKIPLTEVNSHDCLEALKAYCEAKNKEYDVLQAELLELKTKYDLLQKEVNTLKKESRRRHSSWDSSSTSSRYSDISHLSRSSRSISRSISRSPSRSPNRSLSRSPVRSFQGSDSSMDSFPLPYVERAEQEAILNSIATVDNSIHVTTPATPPQVPFTDFASTVTMATPPDPNRCNLCLLHNDLCDCQLNQNQPNETATSSRSTRLRCNSCQLDIDLCDCPLNTEREIVRINQNATLNVTGDSESSCHSDNSDRCPSRYSRSSYHSDREDNSDFSDFERRLYRNSNNLSESVRNEPWDNDSEDHSNHSTDPHNTSNRYSSSFSSTSVSNRLDQDERSHSSLENNSHSNDSHHSRDSESSDISFARRRNKRKRSERYSRSSRSATDSSDSDDSVAGFTSFRNRSSSKFRKRLRSSDSTPTTSQTDNTPPSHKPSSPRRHVSPDVDYHRSDSVLALREELLALRDSEQSSDNSSDNRDDDYSSENEQCYGIGTLVQVDYGNGRTILKIAKSTREVADEFHIPIKKSSISSGDKHSDDSDCQPSTSATTTPLTHLSRTQRISSDSNTSDATKSP